MKRFITFLAMIALAKGSLLYSLNDLGPLQYGINDGSIARQEIRTPDGIVRGTVTYIDGDGKTQTIAYGGDNALPKATEPAEEPRDEAPQQSQEMENSEVVEPMQDNQNEEKEAAPEGSDTSANLPQPVPYTPEVAAARAAHFAARDQAIYLQQLASNQQQLLNQPILEYPPFFRDYYGAAKHLRNVNPFYFL